jgi:thymidine phosphorylase
VVESEGGCVVWGGAVRLSPADDILIRVARVMDLDAEAQLVGSVLSKKIAAGATHVVLDLPVGETAKVRDPADARRLADRLCHTASAFGLTARAEITDGRQPVGRGIGPALEARDVLAVLARDHEAPVDLRERAVRLAGTLLEMAGTAAPGEGARRAAETLDSGEAERRFCAICEAQGGRRTPPEAKRRHVVEAATKGRITAFDNRSLARVAKLAGAPGAPAAGVELHVHLDDAVEVGQPLYTIHAETRGELDYAREFTRPENDHNGRIVAVTSEAE